MRFGDLKPLLMRCPAKYFINLLIFINGDENKNSTIRAEKIDLLRCHITRGSEVLANVNKFKSSKTLQCSLALALDPEAEDSNISPCSNCVHTLIADMLKIKLGNKQILRELESFNYPPCIDQLRASRALCVLEKKGQKCSKVSKRK